MAEIKPISILSRNWSVFVFGLFRNRPVFSIMQSWILGCPKSPQFQKTEISLFSYLPYKAEIVTVSKISHLARFKPGGYKISTEYKKTSQNANMELLWLFWAFIKLFKMKSKWFRAIKIKKNGDSEPHRINSKREVQLVICRRWDLSPDERR